MIYIHAVGNHNSLPDTRPPDLKAELKDLTGKSYRRVDRFIQLAMIGAHKAVVGLKLKPETAIYLVSGQGDIPVFERVRRQRFFQKMMSKPVDFVNLASNTAGFYVASHLGLFGTNLFLAHKHFSVEMALLLAQSDLRLQKQSAILLGGVDEWLEDQELSRKLLGVDGETRLGEGSNWMLLSREPAGALATLWVNPQQFDLAQLKFEVARLEPGTSLAFSRNFSPVLTAELFSLNEGLRRFDYERLYGYYETLLLCVLNSFLMKNHKVSGRLVYIDSDGDFFRVVEVERL